MITKRGKPIARLIPELDEPLGSAEELMARLKNLRKSIQLVDLDWKALRDERRK